MARPRVEFFITKKEWAKSYKKWCDIVEALERGEIGRMRRAFERVCSYCTAFGRASREMNLTSNSSYIDLLDNCYGCPLSDRKLCINDYHEQVKVKANVKGEDDGSPGRYVSTLPYWKIKDTLARLREFPKREHVIHINNMLVLARQIRDAIKQDEKIAVAKLPRFKEDF